MERMFADRYGWRVRVPPSSPADGIQLIGAKRCVFDGRGVPHILYRVNGEEMSLYVMDGVQRAPADLVAAGRRARMWSRHDTTFVLVSPTSAGPMTMAASYLMQEAH
jgi:anti-sigma factor RsiW